MMVTGVWVVVGAGTITQKQLPVESYICYGYSLKCLDNILL